MFITGNGRDKVMNFHHIPSIQKTNKLASFQGLVHVQFYLVCCWSYPNPKLNAQLLQKYKTPNKKIQARTGSSYRIYKLLLAKGKQPFFLPKAMKHRESISYA